MFIDPGTILIGIELAKISRDTDRHMRENLPPSQYKIWKTEQIRERRHQELCKAIRSAGEASKPRGIGIFW